MRTVNGVFPVAALVHPFMITNNMKRKVNMNTKMKRFISIIFSAVIVCLSFNFSTKAHASNIEWDFDDKSGILTIECNGEMEDYGHDWRDQSPWFNVSNHIKKIIVTGNITKIGNNAFRECTELTSIVLPNTIESIGEYAFMSCSRLESFSMPSNVIEIDEKAFYSCSALTTIEIPEGLLSISDGSFQECTALNDIVIPDSVVVIGSSAFSECKSLSNITLSNNLKRIGYDALSNIGAATIVLPDTLESIDEYAFYECENLINIFIPEKVKEIGDYAFQGCSNLEYVVIPSSVDKIGRDAFSTSSIEDIYYAGSQQKWEEISSESIDKFSIDRIKIHYNSSETIVDKVLNNSSEKETDVSTQDNITTESYVPEQNQERLANTIAQFVMGNSIPLIVAGIAVILIILAILIIKRRKNK